MATLTRKLWVGIGCAVITAAPAGRAAAQEKPAGMAPPVATHDAVHAPSEGGEAYLTDGGPADTRIRFYRDLELVRGHLLVGEELIARDLWEEALPHFLHPTEELYGRLEQHIAMHDMRPFRRELLALAQTVKAKRRGAYEQALRVVDERLDAALTVAKGFMHPLRAFAVAAAVEVLKAALSEYQSALADGRFVRPVEYQDGRGFVRRASALLEENATDLAHRDRLAQARLRASLDRLQTAWPSPLPPAAPVLQVEEMAGLLAEFARAAARFRCPRPQARHARPSPARLAPALALAPRRRRWSPP